MTYCIILLFDKLPSCQLRNFFSASVANSIFYQFLWRLSSRFNNASSVLDSFPVFNYCSIYVIDLRGYFSLLPSPVPKLILCWIYLHHTFGTCTVCTRYLHCIICSHMDTGQPIVCFSISIFQLYYYWSTDSIFLGTNYCTLHTYYNGHQVW